MTDHLIQPLSTTSDAFPFGQADHRPGLLVIMDDPAQRDLATMAAGSGYRLLDTVAVADAAARLDMQIGCDCALLFCAGDAVMLERLIVQVETVAIQKDMALIVAADLDHVDLAYACLRDPASLLLCQPRAIDLVGALAAKWRDTDTRQQLHDVTHDGEGRRLQLLSEEVDRIARTLEALTQGRPAAAPSFHPGPRISDTASDYIGMPALAPIGKVAGPDPAPVTAQKVRDLLRARRMRADFLPGDLFADPAWDMLLDLYAARLDHERVSVSSLCIASGVPPTTALRWIKTLTDAGIVLRQQDPHDGRRVFIALTDATAQHLANWFAASRRYLCGEG
ncbi:MAG: winged helix DNA-binding protein [Sphingobium sp.]